MTTGRATKATSIARPGRSPPASTATGSRVDGPKINGPLVLDEVAPVALAAREEAARDGLLARVELDRVRAVGVEVAEEAVLPAGEREEGDRGGHADVHADPAGLDVVAIAAHGGAALGEDRRAVAEARAIDDGDGVVEGVGADH